MSGVAERQVDVQGPATSHDPVDRLLVVHLGRAGALGNGNRVRTWQALGTQAGAEVVLVDLTARRAGLSDLRRVRRLARGELVPEALTWSGAALRAQLAPDPARPRRAGRAAAGAPRDVSSRPRRDAVVFVTARTYDPALIPAGTTVVLDLVDQLSESYRLRSELVRTPAARALLRALALPMARFEGRSRPGVRLVAAGHDEARRLGAEWVPNLVDTLPAVPACSPTTDLLFHGSLSYPPNQQAVRYLAALWPALRAARPGLTLTIAGANPSSRMQEDVVRTPGWTLLANFTDLGSVLAGARLSVAPLTAATGLQNKVLESAAAGVATIVAPEVARGFDPAFPVVVADGPAQWVAAVCRLLEDSAARVQLGQAARAHVDANYRPAVWRERTSSLLAGSHVVHR